MKYVRYIKVDLDNRCRTSRQYLRYIAMVDLQGSIVLVFIYIYLLIRVIYVHVHYRCVNLMGEWFTSIPCGGSM